MRTLTLSLLGLVTAAAAWPRLAPTPQAATATPAELVATYDTLADAILATKKTEYNVVHALLAATHRRAEGLAKRALADLGAGKAVGPQLEDLADLVAQLGNEGDAAVAAIRKRLLEGGHHHHSSGEQEGIYDEGFVIVTRAAKKELLGLAREIAQMGEKPDAAALGAAWRKVDAQYAGLFGK